MVRAWITPVLSIPQVAASHQQAHPLGRVQFLSRLMQESPQGLPTSHTLQHAPSAVHPEVLPPKPSAMMHANRRPKRNRVTLIMTRRLVVTGRSIAGEGAEDPCLSPRPNPRLPNRISAPTTSYATSNGNFARVPRASLAGTVAREEAGIR